MTIEKTGQPHQVWSHGGSTLKKRKKEHKTAKIPALQKLTHIGHARSFGSLLVGWLVGVDTYKLNYENQDVTSMQ